jgi:hypothetical protein
MRNLLKINILFLLITIVNAAEQNQWVRIDYIQSYSGVLDEWKNPGLYSPVNIFDVDASTSYAGYIYCKIYFDKPVNIDEIRIINGFAKNDDLYLKNNRIREFRISFDNSKLRGEGSSEYFTLKDTIEFQSLKLKTIHYSDTIFISSDCKQNQNGNPSTCDRIYKGSKYNDTCLTELAFYYKGQKIEILDVEKLKKDYVARLQADLIRTFSDKSFRVVFTTPQDYFLSVCELKSDKNGNLKASNISKNKYFIGDTKTYIPDMWKVENAKLYLRFNGKWMLYKYYLESENEMTPSIIHLYSMPFEGLPENSEFTWIPGR